LHEGSSLPQNLHFNSVFPLLSNFTVVKLSMIGSFGRLRLIVDAELALGLAPSLDDMLASE
jgi:hypothetical protein